MSVQFPSSLRKIQPRKSGFTGNVGGEKRAVRVHRLTGFRDKGLEPSSS